MQYVAFISKQSGTLVVQSYSISIFGLFTNERNEFCEIFSFNSNLLLRWSISLFSATTKHYCRL